MNANRSEDSADLVTNVCRAFDAMHVPPPPTPAETIDASRRSIARVELDEERPRRPPRFTASRRIAVGGIGLSALAALILLAIALDGRGRVSAMERMAIQLSEVKSYRYTTSSETITTQQSPARRTTWRENGAAYWRSPNAFRSEVKIVKVDSTDGARRSSEEVLEDFVEVFPPGQMGIFIDRKRKTYFLCRYDPLGSTTYPLEPLKLIREDAPRPTRRLGTRQIAGKTVQGYVVSLTTGDPPRRHDWEVWVDRETNLPVEISYQVDDRAQPRTTTVVRLSDFRWNEELDPKLFEATPPAGYREVQPPKLRRE